MEIAERFFLLDEFKKIISLPQSLRERKFLIYWTLKESYFKLTSDENFLQADCEKIIAGTGKIIGKNFFLNTENLSKSSARKIIIKRLSKCAPEIYDALDAANEETKARSTEKFSVSNVPVEQLANPKQKKSARANDLFSYADLNQICPMNNALLFAYHGLIKSVSEFYDKPRKEEILDKKTTGNNLGFELMCVADGIQIHIEYNAARYSEKFIETLCVCYENVLHQLMTKTFVGEIELCAAAKI